MLKLDNITKVYDMGDLKVEALKGVSVEFRKSEFVSILGPSGCGKTTLLNIVGGLDRYTDGDIVINGTSTKEFKDKEWDTYRNHSVGFVFQSYNLIPHQTVLENVELALTLSGVSKEERRQRATAVLERVGLGDKLKNKPNQLSGGQMQRVAIARALVNDPEIILADEPTGALDTGSSVQIMEILKEISKDRLIVMVTHNPELAEEYSTRIVRLLDGELMADSNPFTEKDAKKEAKADTRLAHEVEADEKAEKKAAEKTEKNQISQEETEEVENKKSKKKSLAGEMEPLKKSKKKRMSFFTALALSFKNLLTKKARTFLVAFAGSIGIIGIALILSISSGFSTYVNKMQEDSLSNFPITIQAKSIDFTSVMMQMFLDDGLSKEIDHEKDAVYDKDSISSIMGSLGDNLRSNNLKKFKEHIEENYDDIKDYVNAIQYTYKMDLEFYKNTEVANGSEISGLAVDPNSNALMNMIVKYAMFYFEDKTHTEVTPDGNGNYHIEVVDGVEVDYTFIDQYPDEERLVQLKQNLQTNGEDDLTYAEVIRLSFTLIGFGDALSGGESGSSEASNAMSSMGIFNEMIDNDTLIESQYTLLSGKFAESKNEALLVLDKNNELDEYILYALGIMSDEQMDALLESKVKKTDYNAKIDYDKIVDKIEYKILEERDYWVQEIPGNDSSWVDIRSYKKTDVAYQTALYMIGLESATPGTVPSPMLAEYNATKESHEKYLTYYKDALNNSENSIKVVGIVRLNDEAKTGSLKSGIVYRNDLTDSMIDYHNASAAVGKTNSQNTENTYKEIDKLTPETINIYVNEFESKAKIQEFIEKYNEQAEQGDEISYTDYAGMIMSTVSGIIDAITYVLIAFVSVSLIVSSIMIGIITYISVIERTKEIGVLRSIGASKKDVKRVFTAESFIIGFASGAFGIGVAFLLTIPINLVLKHFTGIAGLAKLPIGGALILVAISVILTLIAGLLPARVAAKKDPVVALRAN